MDDDLFRTSNAPTISINQRLSYLSMNKHVNQKQKKKQLHALEKLIVSNESLPGLTGSRIATVWGTGRDHGTLSPSERGKVGVGFFRSFGSNEISSFRR